MGWFLEGRVLWVEVSLVYGLWALHWHQLLGARRPALAMACLRAVGSARLCGIRNMEAWDGVHSSFLLNAASAKHPRCCFRFLRILTPNSLRTQGFLHGTNDSYFGSQVTHRCELQRPFNPEFHALRRRIA